MVDSRLQNGLDEAPTTPSPDEDFAKACILSSSPFLSKTERIERRRRTNGLEFTRRELDTFTLVTTIVSNGQQWQHKVAGHLKKSLRTYSRTEQSDDALGPLVVLSLSAW